MTVQIHPNFDPVYYAYYLQGLAERFGTRSFRFTSEGFPHIHHFCLGFVLEQPHLKVYLDARDGADIDGDGIEWCDVYAKVNVDAAAVPPQAAAKLLAIGPSFGVRMWNPFAAGWRAAQTYYAYRGRITRVRRHVADYWRQYRYRLPLAAYTPGVVDRGYVFFLGSLWPTVPQCNQYRANFISACRSIEGLRFEGGLVAGRHTAATGFEDVLAGRRYPLSEYLRKLRASAVAFNTPAVQACHGWKLAEYMALGKAIISTPLTRALPAPLVHGKQIHLVDGSVEQVRDAVQLILCNTDYRQELEHQAREYYLRYLQPKCVIERIVGSALASANAQPYRPMMQQL